MTTSGLGRQVIFLKRYLIIYEDLERLRISNDIQNNKKKYKISDDDDLNLQDHQEEEYLEIDFINGQCKTYLT